MVGQPKMAKIEFSEYEVELIRFFAKHFKETDKYVAFADIPGDDEEKFRAAYDRLARFHFVKGYTDRRIEILLACLEAVEAWDNPPLRDRWDETTKWFRSKWWSLPLLVIAVGLPALKGWVDVIKMLLEWMGWIPSK